MEFWSVNLLKPVEDLVTYDLDIETFYELHSLVFLMHWNHKMGFLSEPFDTQLYPMTNNQLENCKDYFDRFPVLYIQGYHKVYMFLLF